MHPSALIPGRAGRNEHLRGKFGWIRAGTGGPAVQCGGWREGGLGKVNIYCKECRRPARLLTFLFSGFLFADSALDVLRFPSGCFPAPSPSVCKLLEGDFADLIRLTVRVKCSNL